MSLFLFALALKWTFSLDESLSHQHKRQMVFPRHNSSVAAQSVSEQHFLLNLPQCNSFSFQNANDDIILLRR